MNLLFEAKAIFNEQMAFYNIFRLNDQKYKAEIVSSEIKDDNTDAPSQLVLLKKNGTWQTEDNNNTELTTTLGAEMDVFNNGYGDILGRIGIK